MEIIPESEATVEREIEVPLKLVNAAGAAALLGITPQRFSQITTDMDERVPPPVGYVNGIRPVWLESDFNKSND